MIIQGKNTNLRLVEVDDAKFILDLRLDKTKNRFISKVENDLNKQVNWIKEYKKREKQEKEFYFIIENSKNERCGVLRLYDFVEDSFCWGSWILKENSPSYMAIESALLVYEFAFYELKFNKSHFDVRIDNEKVVAFHTRLGAEVIGSDELNYYFNYTKEKYEGIKNKYRKYLP